MRERYQLVKKVGNTTIRYISNHRIEKESPSHRIHQRLFHLIQFEMLIPNTLLVNPHTRNGQHAVFLLQPPCIQLVIRDDPEKDGTQEDGQEPRAQKDDFP